MLSTSRCHIHLPPSILVNSIVFHLEILQSCSKPTWHCIGRGIWNAYSYFANFCYRRTCLFPLFGLRAFGLLLQALAIRGILQQQHTTFMPGSLHAMQSNISNLLKSSGGFFKGAFLWRQTSSWGHKRRYMTRFSAWTNKPCLSNTIPPSAYLICRHSR